MNWFTILSIELCANMKSYSFAYIFLSSHYLLLVYDNINKKYGFTYKEINNLIFHGHSEYFTQQGNS